MSIPPYGPSRRIVPTRPSTSSTVTRLIEPFVAVMLLLGSGMASGQLSEEELEALDARVATPYFGEPLVDPDGRSIYVLTVYNKTNFGSSAKSVGGSGLG